MSSTMVVGTSTRRNAETLHQKAVAKERQSRPRKPSVPAPLPAWFDAAAKYLGSLNLSDVQLATVCEHLWLHKSAKYVPVLMPGHAAELQSVIDGVLLADMPSASCLDTPHYPDAVLASDEDWGAFRAFFDPTPVGQPRRTAPVDPGVSRRAQAVAASYTFSPESARWIAGERRGHYA